MIFARLRDLLQRRSGREAAVVDPTGGRSGVPTVPDGTLVYAVGDIHGEANLLRKLIDRLRQDRQAFPGLAATVVFLGDYVDRGPDSPGVLDLLLSDPVPGATYRFLRGNHEQAMMEFLVDPLGTAEWLRFGGVETLASYGVRAPLGPPDPTRLRQAAADLVERLPPAHLTFLRSTTLMAVVGDYAFVHAGIRPGVPLNAQTRDDLLWIREGFVDRPFAASHVVVHGHTITDAPELLPHRIGLDTGAYASGVLSAIALHGTERRVIQVARGA